ncbi:hypothetical protein WJX84_012027 [Apatococcus fuscideae]|uniref:Isopropylmalate dehydrogenase-like domain-containing protein n=1 Tax=Apatococcus fuscideae TaxID=2026836 RepID=A0AAW1T1A9_9CHLO
MLGFQAKRFRWSNASQARALMTYVPSVDDARPRTVTLIPGDGIGREISDAVVRVVDAMKAPITWERFDKVSGTDPRTGGPASSVPADVMESIVRNGVCLKGTLFTPLSKTTATESLNVQLRKQLDTHVNLVHGFTTKGVPSRHENINVVVIRENTEGEYSGLEHEVVPDVVESLKVISQECSRRVAEYAFGYAFLNHRRKVTAIHKANIMKLSDGLFLQEFRKVAKQYPQIKAEEMIIDNTCMQLGARHVGKDIAGKGIANPTASLLATAMMLRHLNLPDFSDRLSAAVLSTLEANDKSVHTPDLGGSGTTRLFTDTVIQYMEDH